MALGMMPSRSKMAPMPLVDAPWGTSTDTVSPGLPGGLIWRLYHHHVPPTTVPTSRVSTTRTPSHRGSRPSPGRSSYS